MLSVPMASTHYRPPFTFCMRVTVTYLAYDSCHQCHEVCTDAVYSCHDMPCYIIGVVHIAFASRRNVHIQVASASNAATTIRSLPCVPLKACGGTLFSVVWELAGIKGEPGGRSGGRCHTGSDESYAADYMSGYEMTGGGSFADIFPAADESQ